MNQVEYIKSNKGGIKIIYKGYMYTVHKNKKCGGIRWRCAQRSLNCKGSISTNLSGSPYINMPHNHLPDHQSIAIARHKFENNSEGLLISDLIELASQADSMPLEQRLKSPPEQEPILQSQPLSPTKLKVTRQSTKPSQPSPKPVTPEPPNEEVCLRWNSHHSNMQNSFPSLLMREQYVDATLVAEGQSLKCHRLILSSCSPYFEEVLSGISPFQHPVLFMKDIPFWVLKSLCDFMYAGEVHIFQNKLEELLAVAETLKIKGLAGKMDGSNEEVKTGEMSKAMKEEKKEEKEVREKKRNLQQFEPTPKTGSKTLRSAPSKRSEKIIKEPLNKEGILDPLDLLEPVYEEVTKESAPPKVKELKSVPLKKGKLKKRKFSEEREESPPPLFLSRKGTRSRPNVKIPKYYHTHYERVSESTIVREPHTQTADPLFQLEEIKSEPLDVEDDVIEIEDNVIGFSEEPEIPSHDEEIIGNYDSPLVNLNDKTNKEDELSPFKKINLVAQPIIMNVHSITEKTPSTLQIVDVTQLKETVEGLDKSDPLEVMSDLPEEKSADDPLNLVSEESQKGANTITITNVQSIADVEETEERLQDKTVDYAEKEQHVENDEEEKALDETNCEFHVESVENEAETVSITEKSGEIFVAPEKDALKATTNEFSTNDEMETENVLSLGILHDNVATEELEPEKTCNEDITNEEAPVMFAEPEIEKILNNGETDPEENTVEPGFHIAKVASEQFSSIEDGTKDVVSEDCASDLGFQITNVVSGHIEDSDQVTSQDNGPNDVTVSELGTFSNHLEEIAIDAPELRDHSTDIKSALSPAGHSLSEETQFLAESLEKLLDK